MIHDDAAVAARAYVMRDPKPLDAFFMSRRAPTIGPAIVTEYVARRQAKGAEPALEAAGGSCEAFENGGHSVRMDHESLSGRQSRSIYTKVHVAAAYWDQTDANRLRWPFPLGDVRHDHLQRLDDRRVPPGTATGPRACAGGLDTTGYRSTRSTRRTNHRTLDGSGALIRQSLLCHTPLCQYERDSDPLEV